MELHLHMELSRSCLFLCLAERFQLGPLYQSVHDSTSPQPAGDTDAGIVLSRLHRNHEFLDLQDAERGFWQEGTNLHSSAVLALVNFSH